MPSEPSTALPATPPLTRPGVSRRAAVTAALAAAGAVAAASTLTGCAVDDKADDPQAIRLSDLAAQARTDANLARDLAGRDSDFGPQLRLVAEQRTQHCDALEAELSRFLQRPTSASAAPSSSVGAGAPPSRASLVSQLARSAKDAGDTAVSSTGYRSALLGSIAAAVRVHAEVVLR